MRTKSLNNAKLVIKVEGNKSTKEIITKMEIPESMTDEEEISDYISDETGFCHNGYELED